jgi:hypothetical protein
VLSEQDRGSLTELAPVLRRALSLDPRSLARFRFVGESAAVLVRLPFGVLVSRRVRSAGRAEPLDVTVRADEALRWTDDPNSGVPERRDEEWRTGLPPAKGWRRLDTVPDNVIRPLVRGGAVALKDAAAAAGLPGARPRAEVADALLDSTVLTVRDEVGNRAEVSLRGLSALTRMGFLRRGGHAHVDIVGRWIRVVGEFGTVYLERPGHGLLLR